eukprot:CAMPEP_0201534284 /NCGR_PEP_ID=MMETSP0161_2-20130828/55817_1 /ASSEMBLY_ACC=CAM_ASM_000251 /TAXON_ID=180227 /ORGANISM="Neoparamoeba aestuarina, Strain SoJaBio B1-5/56/2" /LENGTH=105 /DNA_ID=CAMNT_0047938833 /DNA_START=501 /DNA_END=818 /DNA_ORIENTATION=+
MFDPALGRSEESSPSSFSQEQEGSEGVGEEGGGHGGGEGEEAYVKVQIPQVKIEIQNTCFAVTPLWKNSQPTNAEERILPERMIICNGTLTSNSTALLIKTETKK